MLICEKVFLLLGDFDRIRWQKTLSDSRSAYVALKEHFLRNIEHPEEIEGDGKVEDDPLTDDLDVSPPPLFFISWFLVSWVWGLHKQVHLSKFLGTLFARASVWSCHCEVLRFYQLSI